MFYFYLIFLFGTKNQTQKPCVYHAGTTCMLLPLFLFNFRNFKRLPYLKRRNSFPTLYVLSFQLSNLASSLCCFFSTLVFTNETFRDIREFQRMLAIFQVQVRWLLGVLPATYIWLSTKLLCWLVLFWSRSYILLQYCVPINYLFVLVFISRRKD